MRQHLWRHKAKLGLGTVLFLGFFIWVIGPWPQYHRHYEGTDYYEQSLNNWKEASQSLQRSRGALEPGNPPLQVGFASVKITPKVGSPLRALEFTEGVHDDCWIKAIAFHDGHKTAIIASADLLIVSESLSSSVIDRLKGFQIEERDVFFATTHTHNGPGGWGTNLLERLYTGKRDPAILEGLTDSFCQAILEAKSNLHPASLAFGEVSVPAAIRNRAFGNEGRVDDGLSFLFGRQLDTGTPFHVAVYGAHACNIWAKENVRLISADYPGRLREIVERRTGGFCAFLAGGMGSMATSCPTGESEFEKIEWIANHLADHLLEAAEMTEERKHFTIRTAKLDLVMPPFQTKLVSDKFRLSPFYMDRVGGRKTFLKLLGLDELVLIGTPSDFSGELALDVKAHGRRLGLMPIVTSFNGDYHGYILPDTYYRKISPMPPKGGLSYYETNLMSFHGPFAGSYTVEFMNRLLDAYGTG